MGVEPDPSEGVEVDLQADGLLWLINRVVFHPRGYALGYTPETGRFFLLGDGTDVWRFDLNEGELFERVTGLLEKRTA